jgi:hypothetical protein
VNFPALSVVVLRAKALTGLCISMVAFATTAPVGSTTVPVTEPPPDCALTLRLNPNEKMITKAARSDFLQEASMIPPEIRLQN